MLKTHLKVAWRHITRYKLYGAINILGLSLGICACLVVYLITSYEFGFDRFHPDKERIYRMVSEVKETNGEKHAHNYIPAPAPKAARQLISGIESVAHFIQYPAMISIPHKVNQQSTFDNKITTGSQSYSTIIVEPEYFSIFKYDWLAGDKSSALNRPFSMVITESNARKYFGDEPLYKMIGKQVIFNDSLRLEISGIVKDWDKNTDFPFTEFVSFSTIDNSFIKNDAHLNLWGNENVESASEAIVKLFPRIKPENIDAAFIKLVKDNVKIDSGTGFSISLQPLSDVHFNSSINDNIRKAHLPTLYVLLTIALFSLFIAAINFINLSTAQSIQRAKEIGIRKVLGGNRSGLALQFLLETFIHAFLATCLTLIMVKPVLSAFHRFIPDGVRFHFLDSSTLLFIILVTLTTTLLAGLYPAKVLSSYLPVTSLKGTDGQRSGKKWYIRKALIVFQFAVSLIFIISTLVIGNQMNFIRNKYLGFNSDAILSIDTDWADSIRHVNVLAQKIKQLSGISGVALQSFTPMTPISTNTTIQYDGNIHFNLPVVLQVANEDFIPLYQMKILAGHNFVHSDSVIEYIINETCARELGFANPEEAVGKNIHFPGNKGHPITAVVADFHEKSFHEPIRPILFMNFIDAERGIAVKLLTKGKQINNIKYIMNRIGEQWNAIYPGKPFEYSFLDESIASFYEKERKTSVLINIGMGITIFISCIGLFGLSLFTTRQKTKEIGIRKVLGASVFNIVKMISWDFIVLVILALSIASPIAWWIMNLWLQDFVYRVPLSWWIFPLAGAGAIAIAIMTIGSQAFKAAIDNPVISLRTE
jgi:putative ABC transport system permease protein